MQKLILISSVLLLISCSGNGQNKTSKKNTMSDTVKTINRTEEEWKTILTPEQYHVLREKGTDLPFKGKYYLNKEKGIYNCAACGSELFTSDMKFDSECGWPSFDKEVAGGKIKKIVDRSYGMVRTEILCAKC